MNKTIINVPSGIKYISEWEDFVLPDFPCIIDKQVTGCGFTEWIITNKFNSVLISPRLILLENKEAQHLGEVFYARNDLDEVLNVDRDLNRDLTTNKKFDKEKEKLIEGNDISDKKTELRNQIRNYYIRCLDENKPCKILVTYDSYRIVHEVLESLGCLDSFYAVVDEFQSIFTDSRFKSNTELEFLEALKNVNNLCFVSATPMIDEYLEMLPDFKDLPYYELDWGSNDPTRIIKPQLSIHACHRITNTAVTIINSYLTGNFEKTIIPDDSGNLREVESKELVIYVNSVKNICDIIKKAGLTYENTNVLCSRSFDNNAKIRKAFGLGRGQEGGIGKVPLKDEPRKMFTLCTRTVYLGADFYSDCARSVILSDANIECLAVDITLDLPQILGRQRLDCNPWKNRAELYVKFLSIGNKKTKEDFDKYINNKIKKTNELLNIYSGVSESSAKHTLVETYQYVAKSRVYSENYVAVNTHKGRDLFPVFNNLVMISEKRAFDIQQTDYADRFKVLSKVIIGGYEIDPITDFVNKFISYFKELPYFTDRMRYLCDNNFSDKKILNLVLSQIPIDYSTFYNTLGPERIKALGYQKSKLEKDLQDILNINSNFSDIQNKVLVEFRVGQKIPLAEIKQKLKDIYCEFNYNKTAKATDLIDFFEVSECLLTRVIDGEKKRVKGYELLNYKKEK